MLLCPIRTFFNYTFIAFVDASLPENESKWLMGIELEQMERRGSGGGRTDRGCASLF